MGHTRPPERTPAWWAARLLVAACLIAMALGFALNLGVHGSIGFTVFLVSTVVLVLALVACAATRSGRDPMESDPRFTLRSHGREHARR